MMQDDQTFPLVTCEDGIVTYHLESWRQFSSWLTNAVYETTPAKSAEDFEFIWRGQRDDGWKLTPSLGRMLGDLPGTVQIELAKQQLNVFRQNARGRRAAGAPKLTDEDEWWALGQHYGLATPLLDWTPSPYAAAYFAFEDKNCETEHRVIYALNRTLIERRNEHIEITGESEDDSPILSFLASESDDNPRMISQGGLFTKGPIGIDIATWVRSAFPGQCTPVLFEAKIANSERYTCLRDLARMNIHHLSLFPDLSGACRRTNLQLEVAIAAAEKRIMENTHA